MLENAKTSAGIHPTSQLLYGPPPIWGALLRIFRTAELRRDTMWVQRALSRTCTFLPLPPVGQKVIHRVFWSTTVVQSVLGMGWVKTAKDKSNVSSSAPPQNFLNDTRDLELVSVAPWLIPHVKVKLVGCARFFLCFQ